MEELKKIFFSCQKEMNNVLNNLEKNMNYIRLGSRSIVSFLEKIKVKYYGNFLFLTKIANITIIDNMNISIQPWDLSILSSIDQAIINENLGVTPTNNGKLIHIKVPILTEEGRLNLMKKIKLQTEKSKIFIREIRKKKKQSIKNLKISEDFSKSGEKKIQKITSNYIKKIEDVFFKKKKEILRI